MNNYNYNNNNGNNKTSLPSPPPTTQLAFLSAFSSLLINWLVHYHLLAKRCHVFNKLFSFYSLFVPLLTFLSIIVTIF